MAELCKLLSTIENIIDLDKVNNTLKKTKNVLRFKEDAGVCLIADGLENIDFKPVSIKSTHESMELMLYNQLILVLNGLQTGDDRCYSVRANYGVGILPSLFGAKSAFVDENQMPWCPHLDKDIIRQIVATGKFDIKAGFGQKVLDTYEFYAQTLEKYPKTKEAVKLYHADLQGPLDTVHLIYGSDIYYDMYDEPELVHEFLNLVTEAYIAFMKAQKNIFNDETEEFCYHWNTLYPGKVLLRNDTAVNLSPDMYEEFVRPYDEKILSAFSGGSIHYCGERQAWLSNMLEGTKGLRAINFGKVPGLTYGIPFLEYVRSMTVPKHMNIISYIFSNEAELKQAIEKGYQKGTILRIGVATLEEAERLKRLLL